MTTYQSRMSADAEAAYALLAAHVLDPETGACPICRIAGPCQPANAAANRLADLGLPLVEPKAPRRRRNEWRGWLRQSRKPGARPNIGPMPPVAGPPVRNAPLLSFGWRVRLGLVNVGGRA